MTFAARRRESKWLYIGFIVAVVGLGYGVVLELKLNRTLSITRALGGEVVIDRVGNHAPECVRKVEFIVGPLSRFECIRNIEIISDQLTDADVEAISTSDDVRYLKLSGKQLSDRSCRMIARLRNLRRVELEGGRITDAGVRALATVSSLESLFVHSDGFTGAGFETLSACPNLAQLEVHSDLMCNQAIGSLSRSRVHTMILSGKRVSDEAIEGISTIVTLRMLCVDGTKISAQGLSRLSRVRPDIEIFHAPLKQPPLRYSRVEIMLDAAQGR